MWRGGRDEKACVEAPRSSLGSDPVTEVVHLIGCKVEVLATADVEQTGRGGVDRKAMLSETLGDRALGEAQDFAVSVLCKKQSCLFKALSDGSDPKGEPAAVDT